MGACVYLSSSWDFCFALRVSLSFQGTILLSLPTVSHHSILSSFHFSIFFSFFFSCVCVCVCRPQDTLGWFLLFFFLKQGLINLELAVQARLSGLRVLGICLPASTSHLTIAGMTHVVHHAHPGFYMAQGI